MLPTFWLSSFSFTKKNTKHTKQRNRETRVLDILLFKAPWFNQSESKLVTITMDTARSPSVNGIETKARPSCLKRHSLLPNGLNQEPNKGSLSLPYLVLEFSDESGSDYLISDEWGWLNVANNFSFHFFCRQFFCLIFSPGRDRFFFLRSLSFGFLILLQQFRLGTRTFRYFFTGN